MWASCYAADFATFAFLLVIYGWYWALTGPVIFRRLWMPLLILIFAIPCRRSSITRCQCNCSCSHRSWASG